MYQKDKIKQILVEVLGKEPYGLSSAEIILEEPKNPEYGDYATNVALKLTKKLKKNPKLIAQEIIQLLASDKYDFQEINGFINIRIKDNVLFENLKSIDDNYGQLDIGNNKKICLEYVSANPTGPLHVGHGRWAVIGDVLARILKKAGYQVHREFYVNDIGNQIKNYLATINAVKNNQPIPEDGYHGAYIKDIVAANPENPVAYMQDQQKSALSKAGVDFDLWFSEKSLVDQNKTQEVLDFLKQKNLSYEQDGAVWFKSTTYGDDKDRVLIKSDGVKTYLLSDIAYHKNKLERGFDLLINIWGADHHGYVPRMVAAVSAIEGRNDKSYKLKVIIGQLVSLFRDGEPVRLSKRTGEIITFEEVYEEIGVDAARYFLAMRSADTPLDFDLGLAKKKSNENPVYYVQYAHARICSILRQEESQKIQPKAEFIGLEKSERALILKLLRLPEEMENIAENYTLQRLCSYAEELAGLFHNFYHDCRVISEDSAKTAARLYLISKVRDVLRIVFDLLGVSAPEKM